MLQEGASAVLWQRVKDTRRVLFVEPDPFLGQSLLQEFNTAAVVVEWIRTAAELRERSHGRDASPPRLVFLDWELPGAPHGEPLRLIVEMFPRAAVVVLSRELNGDSAALLLSRGIPSLHKPLHPLRLSQLVLELSTDPRSDPIEYFSSRCGADASTAQLDPASGERTRGFGQVLDTYAASRGLSHQQRLILDHYLNGKSDKEIAQICQCAEATVYEHWRRMAKKAGGGLKSHIIADFHRYLRR